MLSSDPSFFPTGAQKHPKNESLSQYNKPTVSNFPIEVLGKIEAGEGFSALVTAEGTQSAGSRIGLEDGDDGSRVNTRRIF